MTELYRITRQAISYSVAFEAIEVMCHDRNNGVKGPAYPVAPNASGRRNHGRATPQLLTLNKEDKR